MAHLYSGHATIIENPDDEDFGGYLSEHDALGLVDYLGGLLTDDERLTAQTALNVHLQHSRPDLTVNFTHARLWKITGTLT